MTTTTKDEMTGILVQALREEPLFWDILNNRRPSEEQYQAAAERLVAALAKPEESEQEKTMRRLVEADQTEVVYPRGVAKRVPRGVCRCPVLAVGDFCPVHGG